MAVNEDYLLCATLFLTQPKIRNNYRFALHSLTKY